MARFSFTAFLKMAEKGRKVEGLPNIVDHFIFFYRAVCVMFCY